MGRMGLLELPIYCFHPQMMYRIYVSRSIAPGLLLAEYMYLNVHVQYWLKLGLLDTF